MNRSALHVIRSVAGALLILTVFVHVWAASTKPSAIIAALTVAATAAHVMWRRDFTVEKQTRVLLAVASCLLLWAAVSTWINDQYPSHIMRLGQTAVGILILWAVSVTVATVPRIWIVTAAIVLATFISALVGIGILVQGEPFTSLWLWIAEVSELGIALGSAETVELPLASRMTGLAARTSAFAYQLTVAIPLAMGLLLISPASSPFRRHSSYDGGVERSATSPRADWVWRGTIVVILTVLTTALILNATRAAILGVFCGCLVVLAPLLLKLPLLHWRPNLISLAIIAASTFVAISLIEGDGAFNPRLVSVEDKSARARLPMAITAVRYALEYPLGTVVYQPEPRHLHSGLDPIVQEEVLSHIPHNQFLLVLVNYGWPGLALLMPFYGVVLSVFVALIRRALKLRTIESVVLVASLAGCMGSYVCNSLFHPVGPFVGDWYHWIVIGLVFSAHRALRQKLDTQQADMY